MIDAIPGWLDLSVHERAKLLESGTRQQVMQELWRAAMGIEGASAPSASLIPGGAERGSVSSGAGLLSGDLQRALIMGLSSAEMADGTNRASSRSRADAFAALEGSSPTLAARDQVQKSAAQGLRGLGANEHYAPLLESAAARTGLPAAALASIIDAEAGRMSDGSWNVRAENPRSSATGLGQFLNGTWQSLAETPGTWLNQAAEARGWLTPGGRVRDDAVPVLLTLRFDPEASIESIADFARQNLDGLSRSGVAVGETDTEVARAAYLAHHLGLGDARRFLGEGLPAGRAGYLLAAQVGQNRANREIAAAGDPVSAHRSWLSEFVDKKIDPARYV